MNALVLVLLAAAAAVAVAALVPRALFRRAQDRLARRLLDESPEGFRLLTRAERSVGVRRRLPGVLGLTEADVVFFGVFGESERLATSRIQKIVTGTRLSSGRRLVRREVLRLTDSAGGGQEYVLERASAAAWRSHLGLWAVEERKAALDVVRPGKL
ncbi:MAG TPA: hypothetical protein VMN82_04250 [Thermoanaerobaculia bacterium]|nr:hypothetical protein [Thermoanaerobaculia bacterium]